MMTYYVPTFVLLIGIILRWYGIGWSLPHLFHPDEVRILYAVNEISWENLNPHFFAYGSLPIYLLKIVYSSVEALAKWFGMPPHINFFLVGRVVSAFFGSLTLIVLYLFGKRFFSKRVALLGTAFLSFTVLHIQLSHFLTVDVIVTFFILLALYFLTALVEGNQVFRDYLLVGVIIGLALATKISVLPIYAVFFVAHFLVLASFRKIRWTPVQKWSPASLWGMFIFALLLSGAVFFLCQPYAFLDFNEFYRQIKEQSDMVRGISQPPYVIQYEQTTPYTYQIKHLLLYSMGLPLGLLTLIGSCCILLETLFKAIKGKVYGSHTSKGAWYGVLLMLIWILPVFVIVGGFKVKFLRYMLPLIPFFCLLGAFWIERLLQRFPSWRFIIYAGVFVTIAFSALYSLAFVSIYDREDPRLKASHWIYEHLEEGSTILTEAWEFASIVPAAGMHPTQYRLMTLDLYAPDTDTKIQKIAQQLREADVILLATKRLYGSILRMPERYPLTTNYYKLLFNGSLGFTPVKPFTLYPSLPGIVFNDDFADESFSVYDHPKTLLFRKTKEISADDLYALMITAPPVDASSALLTQLLAFGTLERDHEPFIQPQEDRPSVSQEEMSAKPSFTSHSSWQAVLSWFLTVELLALIALPFTALTFRRLADAGYAVSKVVGILLPSYCVWVLNSLGVFRYSQKSILGVLGILSMVAVLIFITYRAFFTEILRTTWKTFLLYEGVFLLAFGTFTLFRAYNPDIFWSESSMDFSFLNVLVRTNTLPPPDPWISGFPLNYYYFGHYLVATLTKLTGIVPQITYNLAFALFPALVIVEVFSLLYTLTKRYLYGTIGVIFSAIIGNLDGFLLLVDLWKGKERYYRFFRPAHEVIPYTIHEFPIWTFLFVDLHAHLLNLPFLIATFLIGLNLLFFDNSFDPLTSSGQRKPWMSLRTELIENQGIYLRSLGLKKFFPILIEAFLVTLIVGTLGVVSSWDYPTGVIFLVLIAMIRSYRNRVHSGVKWKAALRPLGYVLAVILPGSLVCYLPFYTSFSRSGMGLGFVGRATTQLSDFLLIFGFFLFLIFSYLLVQADRLHAHSYPWRTVLFLVLVIGTIYFVALSVFHFNYGTLLFVLVTILFGSYSFLNTGSTRFHWLRRTNLNVPHLYIWLCLVYGCTILAGCELIFVRDFLQGGEYKRMNTIFKFYIPAWLLLSFVATYSFSQILPLFKRQRSRRKNFPAAFRKTLWLICFALLFLLSAVFPVMTIYARRHQQDVYPRTYLPPTLNGLAYLRTNNPDEYRAIGWLDQHVRGTPVILEATGADYLYEYARISANTGLPTVLGWPSHADQREHWDHTHQRKQDINEIYSSSNITRILQLVRHYQIEYIYIGSTERRDFAEHDLQKFQHYPEYFEAVFHSGDTVIYRVRDD